MWPPFNEQEAGFVLERVIDSLKQKKISLSRSSSLSDGRNISQVMLGCLVGKDASGNTVECITLSGITCRLEGCENFVECIASPEDIEKALEQNDREIHELTAKILSFPPNHPACYELKKHRDELCLVSLLKVFLLYDFCCIDGSIKNIFELTGDFSKKPSLDELMEKVKSKKITLPPTGTGDCCAPKLLHYAFLHHIQPVSMAETRLRFTLRGNSCILNEELISSPLVLEPPCDSRCSFLLPGMTGLNIVYRDEYIIVVNKQSGILSVPGRTEKDCISNRVRRLFPDCIDQPAVHRLDMETSGLMVLAFTKEAHRELSRQFESKEVKKMYTALIDGIPSKKGFASEGEMELFFRVDLDNRPHQIWDEQYGKKAVTRWKFEDVEYYTDPLGNRRPVTRVSFIPLTGRTHQLRLAAASPKGFGCPIIGDSLYGCCLPGERLLLHASYLSFAHPVSKKKLVFKSKCEF